MKLRDIPKPIAEKKISSQTQYLSGQKPKTIDRSAPLASQPAVQNGPQNNRHTPAPAKTGALI